MLEAGEKPALCRNCDFQFGISQIQQISQTRSRAGTGPYVLDICAMLPALRETKSGYFFMSVLENIRPITYEGEGVSTLATLPGKLFPADIAIPDDISELEVAGEAPVEPSAAERTAVLAGNLAMRTAEIPRTEESIPVSADDKNLTEVDNLSRHRLPNGEHSAWAFGEVLKNQITAVKEAAIPHAVSRTHQEFVSNGERDRAGRLVGFYRWLGKTAIEVAQSGYAYHKHEAARARVAVEVDEAQHNETTMRPGFAKVLISPKMSRADAPYKVAKEEHVGDDDSLRISWLGENEEGVEGRLLESILVRDIPLESWVSMLRDPDNIWGKSIDIENESSALPVMAAHRELELPLEKLPEGVLSLVVAVLPYVKDSKARQSVEQQLVLFRGDQEMIHTQAVSIARRWMDFEVSLADSLDNERATPDVVQFIHQLQREWSDDDIELFNSHSLPDGSYRMTRRLAARVERAKQNLLWTSAAVVTGNESVKKQMSKETVQKIYDNEMIIQQLEFNGYNPQEIARIAAQNNQLIAQQNVSVGSGCVGVNEGEFRTSGSKWPGGNGETYDQIGDGENESTTDHSDWETHTGPCRVKGCPNGKQNVTLGPCGVCMSRCQRIYDKGGDPTT
jgi:hypothetical protein